MSEPERPLRDAPIARAALAASVAGVVFGLTFLPQMLGLALGGLSLSRREPGGKRTAWLAIAVGLVLAVVWGVVVALLLKWWAASQTT